MAGDRVVHDHWGPGVVVDAKGEGSRAQATVRFDSVGQKSLLLSATPLRRGVSPVWRPRQVVPIIEAS